MHKKLEKIVIFSAIAVVALIMAIIPLSSFMSYQKRLEAYLDANRREEVTDPVLQSLSLSLADGKEFFANGKASPVKSDFILKATYSIGVDVYDDEVIADKFTLDVPEDFSLKGGRVTATFEETEAYLDITLTPVKLNKLYMVETPYIVCYKETERFSPDGMILEAAYNDGTTLSVSDHYVIEDDLMSIGKTFVKVTFTHKNESVSLDIPINVLSKSNFTNGKLLSVKAENEPIVEDGKLLSSANILFRGTFESGNRIILSSSDFTLKNGDKTAIFGKKTVVEVSFKDNVELEFSLPLQVFRRSQAEDGEINGGVIKNGKTYIFDGRNYVETGDISFVGSFGNALKEGKDAKLKLIVNVKNDCLGSIRLTLANDCLIASNGGFFTENLRLNDILTVCLNGALKGIGDEVVVKGIESAANIEQASGVYSQIVLDGLNFFEGDNEIIITFRDNLFLDYEGNPATINIDCLDVTTYGDAPILTLSDYIKYYETTGRIPEYALKQIETRMIVGGFDSLSGACTDGDFIYYSFVGKNNKKGVVAKYKVGEGVVGKTEIFDLHNVKNDDGTDGWSYLRGNLAYVKGKIVCLCEGYFVTVDPDTMRLTVNMDLPFKEVEELYRENPEQTAYTLTYNKKLDRYAVSVKEYSWSAWVYLYIYDGQFNLIKGGIRLACRENVKWGGFELRSTFSNEDYIYVTYSFSYSWAETPESNSKFDAYRYKAMIELIDWNGNIGGLYDIDGFNATQNNYNHVVNFIELKGKFYVGCYDNGGLNGGYLYEVTPLAGESGGDGQQPSKPLFFGKEKDWTILARDERQFVNGSVCDGEFVYFALCDVNSNTCVVEKFTVGGDFVGKTEVISIHDIEGWTVDSANLSDCGDKIRLLKRNGSSVLIDKKTLVVESDYLSLPSALPDEVSSKITGNDDSEYWLIGYDENREKNRKVALIREGLWSSDFRLFVYDKNNVRVNSFTVDGISTSGRTVRSMTTDEDFIYVVCGSTRAKDYSIFLFDWNGKFIKEIVIDGLLPFSEHPDALEVQSIYLEGNKICIVFYDTGAYVYELTFSSFVNMKEYIEKGE